MKVIKIQGLKGDVDTIRSNLEIVSHQYPIFILNSEKPLYKFIEELEMDDGLLFKLNIAKEIYFTDITVMLRDKVTDSALLDSVKSLSNLLESIDLLQGLDKSMLNNCRLVVDTEDNSFISEIIQALIYLNIDLEVMMKKEKSDRHLLSAFRKHFNKIRNSVASGEKAVNNIDGFLQEKESISNTLYDIEKDLEKSRERDLNISVMATKKAGKSVIVNSFLNEQYAPTSLELPTPNTCIYKKSKDDNIRLVYGEEDLLFKSAKEVYKYIYKEFKNAQNDREHGYTLEDMEIYYTGSNNEFTSYTIVDTPGSNYALAKDNEDGENKHKKISYEWIQKSDVVLFLINYSNYLTIDEVEFFKTIKSEFEKHDKFYSLVLVVNKLDEMYMSECENKSAIRFLDYIRCKLTDLGYKGFVVTGTSARSYFDIINVCRIDSQVRISLGETVPIENLKDSMLRSRLKALKKLFIGKSEMSVLSFVDDQLERLECFYGLHRYDLNTLREKSGMPGLMNYTRRIAVQKAYIEVYGALIRSIDERFVKLRNISAVNSLMDSKKTKNDQVEEIENMLNNVINTFKHTQLEMARKLSFEELKDKITGDIRASQDRRLKYATELCLDRIDDFFLRLAMNNSEQLKKIKNRTMDIDLSISNRVLNEELDAIVENFLNLLNNELDMKQNYIKEAEIKMKKLVQLFSEIIRKEYDLKDFNIDVPKIDQVYKRLLAVRLPETYTIDSAVKERVIDSIEVRGNIIGKLANYFGNSRYGYYTINNYQLQSIKAEYVASIKNNINIQYNSSYNALRSNLLNYLEDFRLQIDEQFKDIIATYETIISDVLKNLADSKTDIQNQLSNLDTKLQFFSEVDNAIKGFLEEWSVVRNSASQG
jgi:hypothetical protein